MNELEYTKLRKIIIDANPDIIKLEFGCRLIDSAKNQYYIGCEGRLFEKFGDGMECDPELTDSLENIGRVITLTDVLIAIPDEKNIYISNRTGLFSVWSRALNEMVSQHINWNLQNNSLDWHWKNQKETVDFLFNLLV